MEVHAETPDNDFTTPSPLKDDFFVDETCIPSDENMFFNTWTHTTPLPTPAQVRQAANGPNHIKVSEGRQHVFCFPNLQLIVKYGKISRTPISEGQNLRVPKVYGWCVDGDERFLYMERIEGITMEERWPSLSASEKLAVAEQLNSMVSSMRHLKQAPGNSYLGALHRGRVHEQLWGISHGIGPFDSVKAFTDHFFDLANSIPGYPDHEYFKLLRRAFSDDSSIVFTHTDIYPSNIIMSPTSTDVLAIIDWQEAGWYPEFWEYMKTSWRIDNDWDDYVGIVVQPAYGEELEVLRLFEHLNILI